MGIAFGRSQNNISGFGTPSELTLDMSGEITVSGVAPFRFHSVDTFGGAASDDLVKVNGGNAGELLLLMPESGDRTVVIKNSAVLVNGVDFYLNNAGDSAMLRCVSSGVWNVLITKNAGN